MALEIELRTRQTIDYLVRNLSEFDRNESLKKGFTNAAQVFKRHAKQNMLTSMGRKTGNLWSSLTYRLRNMRSGIPAVVGFNGKGAHAHLLDLGTDKRETKGQLWKGTRNRGSGPAKYFFTRAREEGEQEAYNALLDGIQRAIDRINSRM